MLFIEYRSTFNSYSLIKLLQLGLNCAFCNWLLDFLTGRPQSVINGNITSNSIVMNTGTPKGGVLCLTLYTLFTFDCVANHKDNIILKFTDNTTVVGFITGGDETAYRGEVVSLVEWCEENNLTLNTDKTKEMIVDMRKEKRTHQLLIIHGPEVERVRLF